MKHSFLTLLRLFPTIPQKYLETSPSKIENEIELKTKKIRGKLTAFESKSNSNQKAIGSFLLVEIIYFRQVKKMAAKA